MRHYERRLPHWDVIGQPLFITFRLHGSLPFNRVFAPEPLASSGKAFRAMDRILDGANSGPLFLQRSEIAELVQNALLDGERRFQRYQTPRVRRDAESRPHSRHSAGYCQTVAGPLKGFTSHRANQLLGSQGRPFWQDESYDHLVRSSAEFDRIRDTSSTIQ